ncbi:MAG: purine-nucleoside phosphorylase [Deltaproteobacteria bacterium]|nr:MAG: purine-nucleoside phosphorylase [Deltaproteobacteria bacterium]
MSAHLEAKPGDIAPVVLLPGDPLRAQFIAERLLDGAVRHNQQRNALGYTGHFGGKRISVQSTGMGMPSFSIYAHELLESYGARVLIRVGTCGAMQPAVQVRDVILAMSASTDSAMNRRWFGDVDFAPTADFDLLRRAHDLAAAHAIRVHAGSVLTTDAFYPAGDDWWKIWARHGVLAAEMETAALYTLAARFGARALSILAVSDHIVTGEHASAEDRQTGFGHMAELALALAASVA